MGGARELLHLLAGTVIYRPYVYGFFACFLAFALRHLRGRGTWVWLVLAWCIAFASEYSSTRNGFPFGMYVYIDDTRVRELWISNVPFWDSLSFVFLSYFSWRVAAAVRGQGRAFEVGTAVLGGFLMMLLDVVIDPVTLLGDRWFLGRIYFYPHGGQYFGVTLANFAGWWLVGAATIAIFQLLCRARVVRPEKFGAVTRPQSWMAFAVYAGVFAFNLAVTAYVGAWVLFAASACVVALTCGFCVVRMLRGAPAQAPSAAVSET